MAIDCRLAELLETIRVSDARGSLSLGGSSSESPFGEFSAVVNSPVLRWQRPSSSLLSPAAFDSTRSSDVLRAQ